MKGARSLVILVAIVIASAILPAIAQKSVQDEVRTLIKGMTWRQEQLQNIEAEFLYFLQLEESARSMPSPPPPPEGASTGPAQSTVMGTWPARNAGLFRLLTAPNRYRMEMVALEGNRLPYMPLGIAPRLWAKKTSGELISADFVRCIVIWDGEKRMTYDNVTNCILAAPADPRGTAAHPPLLHEALMLGRLHDSFSSIANEAVEAGYTVVVERLEVDGRDEYRLVAHRTITREGAGSISSECEMYVVPQWGYAVRRYEDRHVGPSSGVGDLLLGSDFRCLREGLWVPYHTVKKRFEYRDGRPSLSYTREFKVLDIHVNGEIPYSAFELLPPLGANVQNQGTDITGVSGVLDQVLRETRHWMDEGPSSVEPHLNGESYSRP